MHTRREFGKLLVASVPAGIAMGYVDSTVKGVPLGVCTYSFRDFPRTPGSDNVDAVIQALKETGAGVTELFSANVEPGNSMVGRRRPGASGPAGGPAPQPARMNNPEAAKAREDLRQWRLSTPMDHFEGIRKKFETAGIEIFAFTMNYRADFTDEEIAKTFEQAKALHARTIATSTQVSMLQRLLPMAEKYKINVSLHGHANTRNPDEFATPETFQKALDMSKYFQVNLDIGHFTAANFDAVAYIQEQHARITHLHIKDRKKDDGANLPFGEGDTPIKPVLTLLKEKKYAIPALVEYEYRGTGTSVEEVKKCMEYMRQALA
jgi:sugar phosphate isomerase/epimerase